METKILFSNLILKDGDWYNKVTGFRGKFNKGKLVKNYNAPVREFPTNYLQALGFSKRIKTLKKCQWCKLGYYNQGVCSSCGTVSPEVTRKFNAQRNIFNSGISKCMNRTIHYKIEYPYNCPYCSYRGSL